MRWILILLIISIHSAQSQSYDSLKYSAVKVDLSNFLDEFPAFLVSYEHPIGNTFYLNHEGGPILPFDAEEGEEISGFKLKEELRYYLTSWNTTDFFLGLAVRYSQENVKKNVLYGNGCNGRRNCVYFQSQYGKFSKRMISFDFRAGLRHHIQRFFIEYDIGYGYGNDKVHYPDINVEGDFTRIDNHPYDIIWQNWKVLVSARFNFGYKFRYREK